MNFVILPKRAIPLVKDAIAQIVKIPAEEVIIITPEGDEVEMSHGIARIEVEAYLWDSFAEDIRLAKGISKILKVPTFTSAGPSGTLDEYIDGEFFKRLRIDEGATDKDGCWFPRFIDPPEGMTEP